MNIYETNGIDKALSGNTYAGRGIIIGATEDGKNAAFAYFIMGRSVNSRNRIFSKTEDGIIIFPFDESLVSDPSLIIYSPVRKQGKNIIVTNGDQTDTVYEFLKKGKSFEDALDTRCFEPDAPNFTPRISGILNFENGFKYKLSILKSMDIDGIACSRETFSYEPISGLGHLIHTYVCDGNPIPSFVGEPKRVVIPNDLETFTSQIWDNLDENNKVSLYTSFINVDSGDEQTFIINKNK